MNETVCAGDQSKLKWLSGTRPLEAWQPEFMSRSKQTGVLFISVVVLFLVSYLDYATHYELLFFVFYFVPVCLCAWYLGYGATVGMVAASGICWFLADKLSGHEYPHEAFRWWNTFMCTVAFASVGLVLAKLRYLLDQKIRSQRELGRALKELQATTEEIRQLQTELQVVCAWTKRIRVDGRWMPLDQFLSDKLHFSISHAVSPEALKKAKEEIEQRAG